MFKVVWYLGGRDRHAQQAKTISKANSHHSMRNMSASYHKYSVCDPVLQYQPTVNSERKGRMNKEKNEKSHNMSLLFLEVLTVC
jgi:hypothetical protein